ncbi:hypothetical protein ACF0H5_017790 [Mactra antiquata]
MMDSDERDKKVSLLLEKELLVDRKNTKFAGECKSREETRYLLPVKKRKFEQVKRQRSKNSDVSQKQCKLDFPPCKVCLGRGSGLHYGVNSCESCKSFFRRCLTRKEEYKCNKNQDCPVTSQVRGNCSGCRYQRCLIVGMSREAACLGRYTLSRRTRTIMEAKGESSSSESKSTTQCYKDMSVCDNVNNSTALDLTDPNMDHQRSPEEQEGLNLSVLEVSLEKGSGVIVKVINEEFSTSILQELNLLNDLVTAMDQIRPFGNIVTEEQIKAKINDDYENYTTKAQVFGNMKPVPADEYFAVLESTGIDIDGRQEFLRQSALNCQPVLHSYIAFANVVPGFSSLSLEDQCSLLKTSHFEVFLFLTYRGYDPDLQMILTETGKAYHIDQAADIFYSRNLINAIFDVCKKIQKLNLSKEETALLLAIAVTFGDRCQLEDTNKVDEIQLKVVQIFRSYLSRTRPDMQSKFFTKIVDCFVAMRAVNDQYLKEYGVICQDKLVQKEAPIWLAYINAKTVQEGSDNAKAKATEHEESV